MLNNLHIKFFIIYLVALFLQATLVDFIQIFNWRPDLLLIILVAYALNSSQTWALSAGFFIGLSQDLVSTHALGLAALSKTVAAFIASSLKNNFPEKTEFVLTLLIAGFAHDLIYFFFYSLGADFSLKSLIIVYAFPNVLYTVIVGYFINFLISQWLYEPEVR